MKGFFQDATGKPSMARLQVFIGSLVGVFMVIFGSLKNLDYLVYAGIGLITVQGGVKAIQKAGEK